MVDEDWVAIVVGRAFFGDVAAARAILCHEVCHYILDMVDIRDRSPMTLTAIEPSDASQDLRTFTCPQCKRVQRHFTESAVTEAWLNPQRGNAITHEIHDGHMISKPAK